MEAEDDMDGKDQSIKLRNTISNHPKKKEKTINGADMRRTI